MHKLTDSFWPNQRACSGSLLTLPFEGSLFIKLCRFVNCNILISQDNSVLYFYTRIWSITFNCRISCLCICCVLEFIITLNIITWVKQILYFCNGVSCERTIKFLRIFKKFDSNGEFIWLVCLRTATCRLFTVEEWPWSPRTFRWHAEFVESEGKSWTNVCTTSCTCTFKTTGVGCI